MISVELRFEAMWAYSPLSHANVSETVQCRATCDFSLHYADLCKVSLSLDITCSRSNNRCPFGPNETKRDKLQNDVCLSDVLKLLFGVFRANISFSCFCVSMFQCAK